MNVRRALAAPRIVVPLIRCAILSQVVPRLALAAAALAIVTLATSVVVRAFEIGDLLLGERAIELIL